MFAVVDVDRFYITLFSALKQTRCLSCVRNCELFTCDQVTCSEVTPCGWLGVECQEAFKFSSPLHSDIFGISDHDLMFSQENPDDEMEEEVELTPAENMPAVTAQHQDYILHRVNLFVFVTVQHQDYILHRVNLSVCLCDCLTSRLHQTQISLTLQHMLA